MKKLFPVLLLILSDLAFSKEVVLLSVKLDVPDEWEYTNTRTGRRTGIHVFFSDSNSELKIDVMTKPKVLPRIEEIHGREWPDEFSRWGDFYGSEVQKLNQANASFDHTWILYSQNLILMASLSGSLPVQDALIDNVSKHLRSLKRK